MTTTQDALQAVPPALNFTNSAASKVAELIQEEKEHWEKGNIKKDKNLGNLIRVDLKTLCKRKRVSENKRKELKKSAHCIRIKGNIIVHSQKDIADSEEETRDVLLMTREFLAEIYNL